MNNLPIPVVPPAATPTVNVIGCGGAGINMVRRALNDISKAATHRYIDTSYANVRQGEEVIVISGEGSGGLRKENAERIFKKVAILASDDVRLADVNIVIFSMSGGSGAILGPLLIREIKRRDKLVIAIAIASSQSQVHTSNMLKTLQSLEHDTNANNIYLPISIFNNAEGDALVDVAVPYKLAHLVELLTMPTIELDKTDRLHWVNVQKTLGAHPGLHLLRVDAFRQQDLESLRVELPIGDRDYIYDSVISIRGESVRPSEVPRARTLYEGIFVEESRTPMIGVIGNPPDAFVKLTKHIEDTLLQYKSQVIRKQTVVDISMSEIDPDSGLIL